MSQVPHSPAHSSEHRPAGRAGAASRSPRSRRSPALHLLGALLCSAALVGCGSQPRQDSPTHTGPVWGGTQQQQSQYGYVRDIAPVSVAARPSGAGAVLGAVLGAAIGTQVGSGDGRKVAIGAGAVAGGLLGHEIEKRNKRDDEVWRVRVRMDDGRTEQFDFQRIDDLRVGDRVRVDGGQLYRL